MNMGLRLDDVRQEVMNLLGGRPESEAEGRPRRSKTPALDSCGRDLTALAREGNLGPLVGRQAELRLLFEVLGGRDQQSPLLLGEPGAGRRTLVAGLADAIVREKVPPWLRGHRVVELHVGRAWAGSKDWKSASERVRAAFHEARRAGATIVFLPDLVATLWAAGRELAARGGHAELLLAVRQGRSRSILSATRADYARCTERWGPLGPAVQAVAVRPATVEETVAVLHAVRGRYEEHHHIKVADGALAAVAQAADRLPGALPGKAVQLLDRCATRARLNAWAETPDVDLAIVEIDAQVQRLNDDKESAVAEQDFQRAAALRDQADKLKQEKERRVQERGTPDVAIVDAATVADVARDLAPPA
jgi:ATP-dependent Clp protease ATP-binding subunit ClpC